MPVRKQIVSLLSLIGVLEAGNSGVWAIDVNLSSDEAHKALEIGRIPMDKANSPEEVKRVLQQASLATRVGADPEKEPCGASAVLAVHWLCRLESVMPITRDQARPAPSNRVRFDP